MKPILPFAKTKKTPDKYFAIEINPEFIKVAIWQIDEISHKVQIIETSQALELQDENSDTLLQAIDMAIATFETDNSKISKVIFGLEPSWSDVNGIKQDKRKILQYVCKNLELIPLGFLTTFDGILTAQKEQNGTFPSAIFVKFYQEKLIFILVNQGKIVIQKEISKTENIVDDFRQALAQINRNQLPNQFFLYDTNTDFEAVKQELLTYSWEEHYSFIQMPSFDSLDKDYSVKAIAIAAGIEATKITRQINAKIPTPQSDPQSSIHHPLSSNEKVELSPTIVSQETNPNLPADFVLGREIDQPSSKSFFTKLFTKSSSTSKSNPAILNSETPDFTEKEISDKPKFKKKILIIFIVFLIFIFVFFAFCYSFYQNKTKANILIYIKPETVEQNLQISASTQIQAIDFDNLAIPATYEEVEVQGSVQIPTTGTKKIGQKASGKITVYNKTKKEKSLSRGKVIISSDNISYILDQDLNIASASSQQTDDGESLTYGKADATIIASDIGAEYNIDKDEEFTIKDISSDQLIAKSISAISGGTSEEKPAVSEADIVNARASLLGKLSQEAQAEISQRLGPDFLTFPSSTEAELTNVLFDFNLNEETSTLTITGSLKSSILTVKETDFNAIVINVLKQNNGQNYNISSHNLQKEIQEVNQEESETLIKLKAKAEIISKIDLAQVKNNLVGRDLTSAQNYLQSLDNYQKNSISLNSKLLEILGKLPPKTENILIQIESASN